MVRMEMIDEIVEQKIEYELTKQQVISYAYLGLTKEISNYSDQDLQDEWDDTVREDWIDD